MGKTLRAHATCHNAEPVGSPRTAIAGAVDMSESGTNRTNPANLSKSVDWGIPEVAGRHQTDAIDPKRTRERETTGAI